MIPVSISGKGTIRYLFHVRYGDHKSHIRHEDTSHVGGPFVHLGGHMILFHIR